ncbi:MAG: prolyl oligopeptidase family serine peptidase [Spirochaetes bacterium]|nr:prolyl oligopeptidase family serine peptidase [Spirochaetota bacterium]
MSHPIPEEILRIVPKEYPAPGFEAPGVRALFYDGLPWNGKPTRVFAWLGLPKLAPGERCPAMVLVHGGGGTAFPDWVRLWNARGYAAIAMDTCGGVPGWHETPWSRKPWPRHPHSGPAGWGLDVESFAPELPLDAQWPYHATAAVVLGHSLLRAVPGVDASRIGLTGVSWGGYLTCLAAGVDPRFAFAAPVFGCGFLGHASSTLGWQVKAEQSRERLEKWLELWDPSRYLPAADMPFLWVNGTNDFAFPMSSLQKSYRLTKGRRDLAIRVRMPHGHGGAGEKPPEILAMAESLFRGGAPLPTFTGQGAAGGEVWAEVASPRPLERAEFNFTRASGHWMDRTWNTVPVEVEKATGRMRAALPPDTTAWYFNVFAEGDLVASSEHGERGADESA